MRRLTRTLATLALMLAAAAPAAADVFYTNARNGAVPDNSIIAGQEANGTYLFACRAAYNGGLHPGKVRPGFKGCNFGFGGKELTTTSYDVLRGQAMWTWARFPGDIPGHAIRAGYEGDRPLFICRAAFSGGVHPGKIRSDFKGCNISYGGREHTIYQYEVLE